MVLAIDFGHSHVKIIQAESSSDGLIIKNANCKPIANDMNTFNPEEIGKSQWVATIQDMCKEMNINPKKIKNLVTGLSGHLISVKQLTTLEMEAEDLAASLEFEAKKHIPLDGTEAILDYHIIGQNKEELDKNDVLLIATTKNTVMKHDEIIKSAGFKTGIFDADAISLSNAYLGVNDLPEEGVDVIINIGNSTTTLLCWGKNHRFFARELDIAGHHFTQATMKSQNTDYNSAEEIKKDRGIKAADSSNNKESEDFDPLAIKVAEKTVYTNLVEELRKTLRYYMKTSNGAFFNKFFLSGGAAQTPGLKEFIAENLNVEISFLEPITNFKTEVEVENPVQYTIAMGMAIRGLEKK